MHTWGRKVAKGKHKWHVDAATKHQATNDSALRYQRICIQEEF